MRKRLLLVLAVIGAVALTGFAVPLALSTAEARTRQFVLQRESDVQRLAGLARDYVRTGDAAQLGPEINAYSTTYGDGVLVVSTRGVPNLSVGVTVTPAVQEAIRRGLRNERSSAITRLTPFSGPDELFVKPVGTGAQVNGAVVLQASTALVRRDIGWGWTLIAAGWVLALATFGMLAMVLSRWILRPLSTLSDGMEYLAARLPSAPADIDRSAEADPVLPSRLAGPPEIRGLADTFEGLVSTVLRSVEAQRRLVADASHQLRNPLSALQFRLDLLEDSIPPSASADFRMVSDEAHRLNDILDGLMTLASVETPTLRCAVADDGCNVVSVVAERVEFWAVVAADRGARITFSDKIGDVRTRAAIGETNLSQLLDVLIDNATRHAGECPVIDISTRVDEEMVEIEVADDGPGIPEADFAKAMQRFYTTGTGTGLGLAIVDVIVRGAGGRLILGAAAAGGLSVRVLLPRETAEESA